FVQAEDGIRDRNVTGVQTCALPIYGLKGSQSLVVPPSAIGGSKKDSLRGADSMKSIEEMDSTNTNPALYAQEASQTAREALRERSEERRVGKESKTQGAEERDSKKK